MLVLYTKKQANKLNKTKKTYISTRLSCLLQSSRWRRCKRCRCRCRGTSFCCRGTWSRPHRTRMSSCRETSAVAHIQLKKKKIDCWNCIFRCCKNAHVHFILLMWYLATLTIQQWNNSSKNKFAAVLVNLARSSKHSMSFFFNFTVRCLPRAFYCCNNVMSNFILPCSFKHYFGSMLVISMQIKSLIGIH